MSSYANLGTLMKETLQSYRGCNPKALLEGLESEGGRWVLKKAQAAQRYLYGMFSEMEYPKKDAYLANFWSDLKYEVLHPNSVQQAEKETRRKLHSLVKDEDKLVDDALRESNLGYDWNPERQTPYSQA